MKRIAALFLLCLVGSCVLAGHRHETLSGRLQGHRLKDKVSIVYDKNGVPHVMAANDEDLYYAVGYVMAQDRFFFMDVARRLGRGELSEIFGLLPHYKSYDVRNMDRMIRSFEFKSRARRGVEQMDEEGRRILNAYANGVNRYLSDAGKELPEYRALGMAPEPWKPEDSFVCFEIYGLSMTLYSYFYEYYAGRLSREFDMETARLFIPEYPADAPYINQDSMPAAQNQSGLDRLAQVFAPFLPVMNAIGSNNWVVGGSMSASGKPILSNDPHVPTLFSPTFWYHIHIKGGSFDAAGLMFAGIPAMGAGTNGTLSWGITNARSDYIDVFREKLNPENPDQYLYKGAWKEFERVEDVIKVKNSPDQKLSYRRSVHGPVIESAMTGFQLPRPEAEVWALHLKEVDFGKFFSGYLAVPRSKSPDALYAAIKDMGMGPVAWNTVYATVKGDIGYIYSGRPPLRPDNQGVLPRSGTGEADWDGLIPFDELPHVKNPAKQFIVTANNKVEAPGYKLYLSSGYAIPSRAARITELLAGRKGLTVDDMLKVQMDVKVMSAEKYVPLLIEDLSGSDDKNVQACLAALSSWKRDGYFSSVDSIGTGVYKLMMKDMAKLTFEDELGKKLVSNMGTASMTNPALWKIMEDPDSKWFDIKGTPVRETRKDISVGAAKQTAKYLGKQLGKDPQGWEWGKLQKLSLRTILGEWPWNKKARIETFPLPGTDETVNNADGVFVGPLGFIGLAGPSSRISVDMADPYRIHFNATTGNSENPESPMFKTTTADWLNGRYRVLSLLPEEFLKDPMGELTLNP